MSEELTEEDLKNWKRNRPDKYNISVVVSPSEWAKECFSKNKEVQREGFRKEREFEEFVSGGKTVSMGCMWMEDGRHITFDFDNPEDRDAADNRARPLTCVTRIRRGAWIDNEYSVEKS